MIAILATINISARICFELTWYLILPSISPLEFPDAIHLSFAFPRGIIDILTRNGQASTIVGTIDSVYYHFIEVFSAISAPLPFGVNLHNITIGMYAEVG